MSLLRERAVDFFFLEIKVVFLMSVFKIRNLRDSLLVNSEKFYFLDMSLEASFKDRSEAQNT